MNISVDYSDIIDRLSTEFVEEASYAIEGIICHLDNAEHNEDSFDESLNAIRRDVHSLKGQAGTFGFPVITQIMHALEDYMEMADDLSVNHLMDIRAFIDVSAEILDRRANPNEREAETLLANLPSLVSKIIGEGQQVRNISILLVMPRGTQRTIVGRELMSCGFRITTAINAFEALQVAMKARPEIAIITREMPDVSGSELSRILKTVRKTSDLRQILLTSSVDIEDLAEELPSGTVIVQKGQAFFGELTDTLIDWGYFGNVG